MEEKLCEIPIYICPHEEYSQYWDNHYRQSFPVRERTQKEYDEMITTIKETHHMKTAWYHNAIIGYISVCKHGYDLFTTLSYDIRSKKVKGGYPDIYYDPSTFYKIYVSRKMSSEEIITKFRAGLMETIQERLKGRYVDMEAFDNISKLIDWHKLYYSDEE